MWGCVWRCYVGVCVEVGGWLIVVFFLVHIEKTGEDSVMFQTG